MESLPPRIPPPASSAPLPTSPHRAPRTPRWSPLRILLNVFLWSTLAALATYNVATGGRAFRNPDDMAQLRRGERRQRSWHQPGPAGHPAARAPSQQPVVLPTNLARIRIELSPGAEDTLRTMQGRFRGFGMGLDPDRPEVHATVRCGADVFTNVALHLKGAAGSFRPYDDKPAFTLNFSKHAKGQAFRGMPKVSLNNSVQDPTFLSEAITRELFRKAGVPVPRTDHVTVEVNGRDLGLYVLAEGWSKAFVRQHFRDDDGNLYDGGFVQDVFDRPLDVVSGKDKDTHPGLDRLHAALRITSPSRRWEALTNALDVDAFISLCVIDMFTCNWDGYGLNRNNYRIFDDLARKRVVFMPHGLDQTFGTGQRMDTSASIRTPMRAAVADAVLRHPEGRRRYLARFAVLTHDVLRADAILAHASDVVARIRPTLAAYSPDIAREHDEWVEDYSRRIRERCSSVLDQLNTPVPKPSLPAPDASAILRNWQPHPGRGRGGFAECERVESAHGPALVTRVRGGRGYGSWRTLLRLDPGSYSISGRVRLHDAGEHARVSLSVNGEPSEPTELHAEGWTPLSVAIAIDQPDTEVQLSADFFSLRGEASFDAEGFVVTCTGRNRE